MTTLLTEGWPHCPECPPDWPVSSDIFPDTNFCEFVADSERICIDGILERPLRKSEHGSMDVPFKKAKRQMSPPCPSLIEK